MTRTLSSFHLEKLNEKEILYLCGFVTEIMNIDSSLIKSVKLNHIIAHLKEYEPESKFNKIKKSIIKKLQ